MSTSEDRRLPEGPDSGLTFAGFSKVNWRRNVEHFADADDRDAMHWMFQVFVEAGEAGQEIKSALDPRLTKEGVA